MGISYTDVRLLTNNWAKNITFSHKGMLPKVFTPVKSVHVTFDNSDGKQQTLTGHHTMHHTTGTIFRNRCNNENTETIESDRVQKPQKRLTLGITKFCMKFNVPILSEEKTWSLTATSVEQLPSSNHVEADTRIILEASKSSNTVIVRGADTAILVLLCYTHSILNT